MVHCIECTGIQHRAVRVPLGTLRGLLWLEFAWGVRLSQFLAAARASLRWEGIHCGVGEVGETSDTLHASVHEFVRGGRMVHTFTPHVLHVVSD